MDEHLNSQPQLPDGGTLPNRPSHRAATPAVIYRGAVTMATTRIGLNKSAPTARVTSLSNSQSQVAPNFGRIRAATLICRS
jgi:hypothetical protein